ncbi:MAG: response regulator, partial [Candidatus Latescibacterota bacterium]|nr:response regulator [Candidatus Latescibacterota bacterium]
MLVDDSAVARHKVGAILCSLKCEVIEAKDGTEALSTLEKETPDLLILDINMPSVTTLDVLTQIRQSKRHAALPVVMLTGDADPKVVTKAISLRADDYIRKD